MEDTFQVTPSVGLGSDWMSQAWEHARPSFASRRYRVSGFWRGFCGENEQIEFPLSLFKESSARSPLCARNSAL